MDIEEYQRLKRKAEELLTEANKHITGDATLVGVGLAIEGQAYATLAAAEASRPTALRRGPLTWAEAQQIPAEIEEILDADDD
jgi:hypothetical protein